MGLKTTDQEVISRMVRLYDLEAEIGERSNVAGENPEVVARLNRLAEGMMADIGDGKSGPGVRPPGVVENPVTLYPTEQRAPRKGKGKAAKNRKPVALDKMKVGDLLDPAVAPVLVKTAFSISCDVETDATAGMLIGHGGSSVGFAIYLQAGKPVLAVRSGTVVRRLIGEQKVSGRFHLDVRVDAKGGAAIAVNGRVIASGDVGTLPRHPQEAFCLGFDERNPVDTQAPQGRFKGSISTLKIVVGKLPVASGKLSRGS